MKIEYFDVPKIQKKNPDLDGWKSGWAGTYYAPHFRSTVHSSRAASVHKTVIDAINEGLFEDCCMLSILRDMRKENIAFMELGAGWGAQTADLVGIIRNEIVETKVKSVECFAVEAEPFHFKWLQEMLLFNRIEAVSLFGAMDNEMGTAKFKCSVPSADSYGQSVNEKGNLEVPKFSLDYIVETYQIKALDLVHMDVQGNEIEVLKGAKDTIAAGKIDYFLIGTHREEFSSEIKGMLKGYECVVDLPCRSGLHNLDEFPKRVNVPQDGIMVLKRL